MKATNICTSTTTMLMSIKKSAKQGMTHPFGDHRTVKQAFPAGIKTVDSEYVVVVVYPYLWRLFFVFPMDF
jgi:hypothetical protein